MKIQQESLQSKLLHMEKGPSDLRRPGCGTASQMRCEQQIVSLTSGDWSAPGPDPNADAPSAVVLEVSFMFKLKVVEGHVSLPLALAVHGNPCARLMAGRMHV